MLYDNVFYFCAWKFCIRRVNVTEYHIRIECKYRVAMSENIIMKGTTVTKDIKKEKKSLNNDQDRTKQNMYG